MKIPHWLGRLLARVEVAVSGYFDEVGWFRTRAERLARDASGQPIPWFTYPSIAFLERRIRPHWRVLEFGAGMSTMWWSQRVAGITAVEHDSEWAKKMGETAKATILRADGGSAAAYLQPALGGGPYEIVVVDGIHRNECLDAAPSLLTADGVVILDDAQRDDYREAVRRLLQGGFRTIEFFGPTPVGKHGSCTAIFYRADNVLGI